VDLVFARLIHRLRTFARRRPTVADEDGWHGYDLN
jgi:hypothetical protein